MLYPLSYEGVRPILYLQRKRRSSRACRVIPTPPTTPAGAAPPQVRGSSEHVRPFGSYVLCTSRTLAVTGLPRQTPAPVPACAGGSVDQPTSAYGERVSAGLEHAPGRGRIHRGGSAHLLTRWRTHDRPDRLVAHGARCILADGLDRHGGHTHSVVLPGSWHASWGAVDRVTTRLPSSRWSTALPSTSRRPGNCSRRHPTSVGSPPSRLRVSATGRDSRRSVSGTRVRDRAGDPSSGR